MSLPEKGERLRIVGDVDRVNDDIQVQKALRRLTAAMAPRSLTQLVMWRLSGSWIGTRSRSFPQSGRMSTS